jgi:hypothetical protein
MDFSWGWVKPDPVMATEPLAQARLVLARTATPQATLPPVESRPVLGQQEQGSQRRQRALAPAA